MKAKKEKEYSVRFRRHANELKWLYCELYHNDLKAYELDGTPQSEPAMHPTAIRAVLGAASAASESEHRLRFLKDVTELPMRKGVRRYYDNCLYFFCLLMLTGNYRIYL